MTTLQTGRDLSLTVDDLDYNQQGSSVLMSRTLNRERYETLAGPRYRTNTVEGSLQVTLFTDWGETGSLLDALEAAATNAPDTSLPFTFTAGATQFTGAVFPVHPDVGGEAPNVTQVTVELTLDSDVPVVQQAAPDPVAAAPARKPKAGSK